MENKQIPRTVEGLESWINDLIKKVFETNFSVSDFTEMVRDKLITHNKGVDEFKLQFTITEYKHITFGNLYTALVYMGFWDDRNQGWQFGTLVTSPNPHQDTFIMTNGTRIELAEDGNVNVMPVKPIEYIQLNVVVTKNKVSMSPI
jgi:hypothetical protein